MEFREALLKYDFDRKKVEEFLKQHDLLLDEDVEYTLLLEDDGKIIGIGSISGKVLKCIAVDNTYQGFGLSNKIVSKLIEYEFEKGRNHLFIFTKPSYKNQMEDFGFKEIAQIEDKLILLDNRITEIKNFTDSVNRDIEKYLQDFKIDKKKEDIKIATIVMNANPFTFGHKYLVEKASLENDVVVVFVVEENKSKIPYNVRFECVKEGLLDIKNAIVHRGGDYIISSSTFPTYFLKDKKIINDIFSKLDATIFAKYIAKDINIKKRYVGEEPLDVVTENYNENLKKILSENGIVLEIISRKTVDGNIISASSFRKYLADGDIANMEKIAPKTTIDILKKWELLEKVNG